MNKTIFSFNFFGMPVKFALSAFIGSDVLIVLLTIAALTLTELTLLPAILAAILATLIHWFMELIHMYGHFIAAKQTGYPSTGVKLWAVIGTILYPKDEPELAPNIHIHRALGGPIANTIALAISIVLAVFLWSNAGLPRFLLGFTVFSNIVFSIGALTPIRMGVVELDGGTILHWMGKRAESNE